MSLRSILTTIIYFFVIVIASAQGVSRNATLLSHVPFDQNSSDIWGYEKDGIHYAIIGNARKTSVFSLEDPKSPILRYEAPGAQSIWRDIKSYKNHLYVTTDQGADGVVIIDMTNAPEAITHIYFKPEITLGERITPLDKCHNLYIDEKGIMYLAGCNVGKGGVLMFDLNEDPNSPDFVGAADLEYSHDAFARGDTLYASEIYLGAMTIYDVSDKANPIVLASQPTSRLFTHNIWPSDDGKYAFTTDERGGAYVDAYDISDLSNVRLLDKFRPLDRETDNVIPHNTHYYKGFLVISWYTDGLRIVDAHRPENLIEVAHYDTWEDPSACHNGFFGCWGAFPYTGSNIVYASDINNGLYVVDVDYKRACYLEGKITNEDGNGINNAFIQILSDQTNKEYSSPSGDYKTGQVLSGRFKARITHPNYLTEEVDVELDNGVVTTLNITMKRKKDVPVVFDIQNEDGLVSSKILLRTKGDDRNISTSINQRLTTTVPSSDYEVFINAWGSLNYYNELLSISTDNSNEFVIHLDKGYQDNFETNIGWTVNSTQNMGGSWVLATPRKTEFNPGQIANPDSDSDDVGIKAYVTGNGAPGAGCDDVDNGVTTLTSPVMDLTSYGSPKVNYDVWFFNAGGNSPINDTLFVKVSNGKDTVIIDKVIGITNGWMKVKDMDLKSFIELTDSMHLIVEVSDLQGSEHIVEAGFDNFLIKDFISSTTEVSKSLAKAYVFPNPAMDILHIRTNAPKAINEDISYYIVSPLGVNQKSGSINFHSAAIDISLLAPGVYYIMMDGYHTAKFVKM